MSTRLHRAAAKFCAAKDRERVLCRSLLVCLRTLDPNISDSAEPPNEGGNSCAHAHVGRAGTLDTYGDPLPRDEWCDNCRTNIPAFTELRKVRRQLGGLMRTMRAAARAASEKLGGTP